LRLGHGASLGASSEERHVVEFLLVGEDVRVGVRRHGEVPLPDELADPRPGFAAQVKERDPPVAQVVRAEQRDARRLARLCDRSPQRVGSRVCEQAGLQVAILNVARASPM
jgi:hypothetical protein